MIENRVASSESLRTTALVHSNSWDAQLAVPNYTRYARLKTNLGIRRPGSIPLQSSFLVRGTTPNGGVDRWASKAAHVMGTAIQMSFNQAPFLSFRMVREDTGAPNEGSTCALMVADEAVGCTRAFLTMWRSSRRLALLASGEGQNRKGWKLKETIEYLIKQLNSSSVDFLSTYMILPILNGKSLDDISQTHCSDSLRKLSDDPTSDVKDYVGPVKRIYYSLYIGDEKDSTITISLRVPVTYTVTQIMNLAASTDSKYKYESSIMMGQKYVYKIANTANDPESGKFWLMYVGTYDIKDDTLKLSETDPDEIVIKEGEHLVMWYRTADIQFSEEEPEIELQFV
ncbi:uncharacterized protein TNCV_2687881 [Trichonephila clavipes]|nr:uncharacterized protein TNCV_2687881 [Trichonephila clavipes]